MSTTVVYGGASDGGVYGFSGVYATARTTAFAITSGLALFGQQCESGPNYDCYEQFYSFDTGTPIPDGDTVFAAVLALYCSTNGASGSNFTAEARLYDWGATLTTADWISGANLGTTTPLVASYNVTSTLPAVGLFDFTDVALPANVSKTGVTRLVISSSRQRVGNTPAANPASELVIVAETSYEGTDRDPKLTITHGAAPTVTTAAISAITGSGATSGGTVTADGGLTLTDCGICWNTAGTPTIADSHVHHATPAVETFAENLTSLSPGTTYHVRAFAVNSAGTSYGAEVDFTTTVTATGGSVSTTTLAGTGAYVPPPVTATGGSVATATPAGAGTYSPPKTATGGSVSTATLAGSGTYSPPKTATGGSVSNATLSGAGTYIVPPPTVLAVGGAWVVV